MGMDQVLLLLRGFYYSITVPIASPYKRFDVARLLALLTNGSLISIPILTYEGNFTILRNELFPHSRRVWRTSETLDVLSNSDALVQ